MASQSQTIIVVLPSGVNINPHGHEGLKSREELRNVRSCASIFNADQGKRVLLRNLWSLGLQAEFCCERSRNLVNKTGNTIEIKWGSGEPNLES
jgi:hypothetical protein